MESSKRILVAGSKNLLHNGESSRALARKIGAEIVAHGWSLLTGGAMGEKIDGMGSSVDYCAADGARDTLKDKSRERQQILTVHPQDVRHDLFEVGTVIKSRAHSTIARRFELAHRADSAFFIEGHEGTGQLIEFRIASGKGFTGGIRTRASDDDFQHPLTPAISFPC